MCNWFRDHRTVEVHQSSIPTKRYQFVRSPTTTSHHPPAVTIATHRSLQETKPVKDTFRPREGEDLPPSIRHGDGRGGDQTQDFHPLPPNLHQQQHPPPGPPVAPQPFYPPAPPHHHNRGRWSASDNSTVIVDDRPERVVSRIPRRDGSGRRIARVNRRSTPSSSSYRDARGQYYYYSASSDGGDSWEEDTARSQFGDAWSDRGRYRNGGARQGRADDTRGRAIQQGGRIEAGGRRDGSGGGYYQH